MAEWADIRPGDHVLEPSAGHGAIGRWFPENSNRTLIEPEDSLASKAALQAPGSRVLVQRFEDLHAINKYDAIVMNPPFGNGGKTAIEHLDRAVTHLREGGRIVALIPEGPAADKRLEAYLHTSNGTLHQVADIKLPAVTFERAGTQARTHIVVLEKHSRMAPAGFPQMVTRDYSGETKINDLFDRLEHSDLPPRTQAARPEAPPPQAEVNAIPPRRNEPMTAPEAPVTFKTGETKHTKTGQPLFVASRIERLDDAGYREMKALANEHGGYYSSFRGSGAIPGFQFKTEAARDAFVRAAKGERPAESAPTVPHDRPMAAEGLTSYRAKSPYGWVMIGAKDDEGAMREARRSTDNPTDLQVWNGREYVPAGKPDLQVSPEPTPLPENMRDIGSGVSITDPKASKALEQIKAIVSRMAPQARQEAAGVVGYDGKSVEGATIGSGLHTIVSYAMEGLDPLHTAHHEVVHALVRQGLIKPEEWKTLTDAAVAHDWQTKYNVQTLYPDLSPSKQLEEAIAERSLMGALRSGQDFPSRSVRCSCASISPCARSRRRCASHGQGCDRRRPLHAHRER